MSKTNKALPFCFVYDSSLTQFFKLEGIVLWPFVFISKPKDRVEPRILKHELVHVDQGRREGPCKFYAKYIYYIYKSYRQYGNLDNAFFYNEYEDEAYENESKPLTDEEVSETNWQGPRSNRPSKRSNRPSKRSNRPCKRSNRPSKRSIKKERKN